MNERYQIIDSPLPPDQDFRYLKEEGHAFIQQCMGYQWTNFNASDPGVTILDQVCYALTELGYCNAFPVAEILTGPDGNLQTEDQFYLPEEILTSSPLTIGDYRKFIVDAVEGVENALIIVYPHNIGPLNSCYQVYLSIDPAINSANHPAICKAAFYSLNKSRNLGELFLMPHVFEKMTYLLRGDIQIENEQEQNNVLLNIQAAISNYIFPKVNQAGYNQLIEKGISADQVFNGPLLKNGWITDEALGSKKDQLQAFELGPVIESVPGVVAATVYGFCLLKDVFDPYQHTAAFIGNISCEQTALLYIDIVDSRTHKCLNVTCNDKAIAFHPGRILSTSLGGLPETEQKIVYGAKVNIRADLPKGEFRDINTYYSIQNTFPEIFALGEGAISATSPPVQIAMSRQLKGYLTLFDQVLANQFSQLSNIGNLFSFKNTMTGAPADLQSFNAERIRPGEENNPYPAPYKVFSPGYFYQSLYTTPGIKPLLKDNAIFKYSYGPASEEELEEKAWIAYKQDPYNAYMYGLMQLIEDEQVNLHRRNEMLDHLLARHGESPFLIEAMTDGFAYTGNTVKDKVIYKSLYLQNLYRLSYNRQKAYNYLGADEIGNKTGQYTDPGMPLIDKELPEVNNERIDKMLDEEMTDFIFNSDRINQLQRITERDLVNYSATELKLNLLFGLRFRYLEFIRAGKRQKEVLDKAKEEFDQSLDIEIIKGLIKTALDLLEGKGITILEKDIKAVMEKIIEEGLLNELIELLKQQVELQSRMALWFIEKRKGLILIETALLWKHLGFNLIITQNAKTGPFWMVEEIFLGRSGPGSPVVPITEFDYAKSILLNEVVKKKSAAEMHALTEKNDERFEAGGYHYRLIKQEHAWLPEENYQQLNTSGYLAALTIPGNNGNRNKKIGRLFNSDLLLIFPGFVDTVTTALFKNRLDKFLQNTLPVTASYSPEFVDLKTLIILIPAFIKWHESLRFHPPPVEKTLSGNAIPVTNEEMDPQRFIINENIYRRRCTRELLDVLIEISSPI